LYPVAEVEEVSLLNDDLEVNVSPKRLGINNFELVMIGLDSRLDSDLDLMVEIEVRLDNGV
jgi:hypothetical protein